MVLLSIAAEQSFHEFRELNHKREDKNSRNVCLNQIRENIFPQKFLLTQYMVPIGPALCQFGPKVFEKILKKIILDLALSLFQISSKMLKLAQEF